MEPQERPRIALDPGHGGDKPGAVVDPDVEVAGDEVEEEDINLSVVLETARRLREAGYEVLLTRDRDIHIPLEQRKAMMLRFAPQAIVSVHCNATEGHDAHGVEAFYRDARDYPLARTCQQFLAAMTGLRDRGVFMDTDQLGKRLTVLDDSPDVPATLVELGFIDHEEDRMYLTRNIVVVAEILANAIHAWATGRGVQDGHVA